MNKIKLISLALVIFSSLCYSQDIRHNPWSLIIYRPENSYHINEIPCYVKFEDVTTKEDIAEYLTEQVFFDPRDTEVFLSSIANTEYGFFWEGGRAVLELSVSSNDSVSTILESHEDIYDELVADYLEKHYAGRIAVYGE